MYLPNALPTLFAQVICSKVDLFSKDISLSVNNGNFNSKDERWFFGLQEFQQMIIGGARFEDALHAYHGVDLSEEQMAVLKIVEKSTKPWLLGHIAGILTEKLNSKNEKDSIAAAQIILGDIIRSGEEGPTMEKANQLILKLAK